MKRSRKELKKEGQAGPSEDPRRSEFTLVYWLIPLLPFLGWGALGDRAGLNPLQGPGVHRRRLTLLAARVNE